MELASFGSWVATLASSQVRSPSAAINSVLKISISKKSPCTPHADFITAHAALASGDVDLGQSAQCTALNAVSSHTRARIRNSCRRFPPCGSKIFLRPQFLFPKTRSCSGATRSNTCAARWQQARTIVSFFWPRAGPAGLSPSNAKP
jgi:hypothetical protein